MTEYETKFCEVSSVMGSFIEHLFLALLEQLDRLLTLAHQVVDEDAKVLVAVQNVHPVLVLAVDQSQSLISVWQNVQDERRRVFQVHPLVLTQLHHFVHQLPGFVQHSLVC